MLYPLSYEGGSSERIPNRGRGDLPGTLGGWLPSSCRAAIAGHLADLGAPDN